MLQASCAYGVCHSASTDDDGYPAVNATDSEHGRPFRLQDVRAVHLGPETPPALLSPAALNASSDTAALLGRLVLARSGLLDLLTSDTADLGQD